MALQKGSVTVDESGTPSGSGLSLRIFNAFLAHLSAEARAAVAESMIPVCEGLAEAIVDEITENAVVTVTIETSDSGLQRTPTPNNPDTPTQGPAEDKEIFGTIA